MSIETMLFDQDYVSEMYERELYEEAMAKGEAKGKTEGKAEGITYIIVNLVKEGLLSIDVATKKLNLSEKEFMKLLAAK